MKQISSILLLVLLVSFQITNQYKIDPRKVVLAINCGSSQPTQSLNGFAYKADQDYSGGKVADYTLNQEASAVQVKYSDDQTIYKFERHDDYSFNYQLPIKTQGKYVLVLQFCENYFREKGKRVFNIKLGNTRVVENVDIVANVGKFAAYDVYVEFEIQNDLVKHNGRICEKAYDNIKSTLKVEFEKIGIDNPLVNGIVLLQGTLEETSYRTIEKQREQWENKIKEEQKRKQEEMYKKEQARLKKKEKIKVRNDQEDEDEDEIEEIDLTQIAQKAFIQRILEGPLVLFGVVGGFLGVYYFYLNYQRKLQGNFSAFDSKKGK